MIVGLSPDVSYPSPNPEWSILDGIAGSCQIMFGTAILPSLAILEGNLE